MIAGGSLNTFITVLVFVCGPGYLEYRAVRDMRTELDHTRTTGKVRGHLVGLIGIVLFLGFMQLLVFLSLAGINRLPGEGQLLLVILIVTLAGFLAGKRQVGTIGKRTSRVRKVK